MLAWMGQKGAECRVDSVERTSKEHRMAADSSKLILHERPPEDAGQTAYTTRVEDFIAWGRKNSLWPMPTALRRILLLGSERTSAPTLSSSVHTSP